MDIRIYWWFTSCNSCTKHYTGKQVLWQLYQKCLGISAVSGAKNSRCLQVQVMWQSYQKWYLRIQVMWQLYQKNLWVQVMWELYQQEYHPIHSSCCNCVSAAVTIRILLTKFCILLLAFNVWQYITNIYAEWFSDYHHKQLVWHVTVSKYKWHVMRGSQTENL